MKLGALIFAVAVLSAVVESSRGPRRPPPVAPLRIPRGGAGIFGKVMDVVEDRFSDVAKYSKVKAAELDDATERIKGEALERGQRELKDLQREANRLAAEAESAAKSKAAELQKEAKAKADDLASVARETALQVATRWEKEARKKADDVEKAVRKKAAEVEKESRKSLAQLEKRLSGKATEPPPPPPKPTLLSSKSGALLAHVLLLAVALTSLTNLSGYPPAVVAHWEGGFGDKFFPFDAITLAQKRFLAGAFELSSIFLMRPKKTRAAGVGLITAMYTWSAVVTMQLNLTGKAVLLAVLSSMAWLLLANEVL